MGPRYLASVLTAMLGLGLLTTACSSSSSTSTSTTPATSSAKPAAAPVTPFLGQLGGGSKIASTVPAKGDVDPYGLAVVPATAGRLTAGDILVSNFNDKANVQGTGTTIVQVSPAGQTTLFADLARLPAGLACPGGVGLTTALGILPGGWVVVGSLPTTKSGALPGLDPARCLIVLNDQGAVAETITNKNIVGPSASACSSCCGSASGPYCAPGSA